MSQWIFIYKWPSPVSGIQQPTTSARLRRRPASAHLRRRLVFIICQCSLRHQSVPPSINQQPPSSVSGFHQSRFSTTFSRACVSKDLRRLFICQRSSLVSAFDTYWPSPVNNLCQSLAFVFLSLRQSWSSFINQWISSIIGFQQPSSLIGLCHSLNFISW